LAATNGKCIGFFYTRLKTYLKNLSISSVLYLGDHDKAGRGIEKHSRETIEKIAGYEIPWRRLAVTEAQIVFHSLAPIEKIDKRHNPPLKYEAVECEALSQKVIFDIVRDALKASLPAFLGASPGRKATAAFRGGY
jgi:hypothetical protein